MIPPRFYHIPYEEPFAPRWRLPHASGPRSSEHRTDQQRLVALAAHDLAGRPCGNTFRARTKKGDPDAEIATFHRYRGRVPGECRYRRRADVDYHHDHLDQRRRYGAAAVFGNPALQVL